MRCFCILLEERSQATLTLAQIASGSTATNFHVRRTVYHVMLALMMLDRSLLLTLLVSLDFVESVFLIVDQQENFIQSIRESDGEQVTRVHFNNVTAIRTSIADYDLLQVSLTCTL